MTIEKIRVSIGSASVLGLYPKQFEVPPTTCYIMTYKEGLCSANCAFCPQSRSSTSKSGTLSRISWPIFDFEEFLNKMKYLTPSKRFKRICIQSLNYPENFKDLMEIVIKIKNISNASISVAIPPVSKENLKELKLIGVDRIGIALDGATKEIFNRIKGEDVKGPYTWEGHHQALKDATDVFSREGVSTHLIMGLGETEKEMLERIEELNKSSILVSLFAFTPVKGTKFENMNQPDLQSYRKLQLSRYLIINKSKSIEDFTFNSKGAIINININKRDLRTIIEDKEAFMTSGCPNCNRPYYTSRPSGPMYNYPRKLTSEEEVEIYKSLERFVK